MHIAIIGSGQLARMLALAGWRLGFSFSFYAEENENTSCVEGLGNIVQSTPHFIGEALYQALGHPDVVTVERESVDLNLLYSLAPFCAVHPCPEAIKYAQHRGREKRFLNELGIQTAPFELVNSDSDLNQAIGKIGFPCILKSCEDGYDGRAQWKFKHQKDVDDFLNDEGVKTGLILEGFVNFDRELSIISAHSRNGDYAFYPLTENTHRNGILVRSIAPAELKSSALQEQAEFKARKIIDKFGYFGVLSIEFFEVNNELVVNEIAPRVHNSGHWTQAAGISSQFENHVLAISGHAPKNTQVRTHIGMLNLLGQTVDKQELCKGNVEIHEYNKSLRPNRKVGHVNIWHIDREQLRKQLNELENLVYGESGK